MRQMSHCLRRPYTPAVKPCTSWSNAQSSTTRQDLQEKGMMKSARKKSCANEGRRRAGDMHTTLRLLILLRPHFHFFLFVLVVTLSHQSPHQAFWFSPIALFLKSLNHRLFLNQSLVCLAVVFSQNPFAFSPSLSPSPSLTAHINSHQHTHTHLSALSRAHHPPFHLTPQHWTPWSATGRKRRARGH